MAIGSRVKRLRKRQGLTQEELAKRSGVSQAIISRLETEDRSNVTTDVLKGLAKALVCTADYLIDMQDDDEGQREPAAMA